MAQYLLVITEDGYGKRVLTSEIPRTNRRTQGVSVSHTPIAAALVVDESTPELIIQTRAGKTQRIKTSAVPIRHRARGRRGVRLIRLMPDDLVASVAPVASDIQIDTLVHAAAHAAPFGSCGIWTSP